MKKIKETLRSKGMEVAKFQGIRNDETKKICAGYLFIKFHENVTLFPVEHGHLAKDTYYRSGRHIGFSLQNVASRKEAIEKFNVLYVVVDHKPGTVELQNVQECDATAAK